MAAGLGPGIWLRLPNREVPTLELIPGQDKIWSAGLAGGGTRLEPQNPPIAGTVTDVN